MKQFVQFLHTYPDSTLAHQFKLRVDRGAISRDETVTDHFCVYFAAFDPQRQQVFLGHHKKSGLWLFNGGHLDHHETPFEAANREIGEEWGVSLNPNQLIGPALLTITTIPPTQPIPCRIHYDVWYFVQVSSRNFTPNAALLATEFYENQWLTPAKASRLTTDQNTLTAINYLETHHWLNSRFR